MYYVFTSLKDFLFFLLVIFIFIGFGFFSEAPLLAGCLLLVFLPIHFRDYKIIIDDEKIIFHSIFRKKRSFIWTDISKFEIEEEVKFGRLVDYQNLNVYTDGDIFSFNLNSIDKKVFLKQLINCCSYHNILITDLNTRKQ